MWHYNREDDASRYGRKGPKTPATPTKILAELYKGEKEDFTRLQYRDRLSMYNPPSWVRFSSTILVLYLDHLLTDIILSAHNRNGERLSRGSMTLPPSQRIATGILTLDMKKIRTYLWILRKEYFIR